VSLIWTGLGVINLRTLGFAVVALFVRTLVLYPMLTRTGLDQRERKLVSLFGPRGLSALLFLLVPVFAGVPGSRELFTVACLVVLLSVVIHGGGIAIFLRANSVPGAKVDGIVGAARAPATRASERPAAAKSSAVPEKIELAEVRELLDRGEPVTVIDSRTEKSYRGEPDTSSGAVRIPPDDAVREATEKRLSQHSTLVVYCA
jgi:NhaP-type Na+/H+ or K+/H+ antiporter